MPIVTPAEIDAKHAGKLAHEIEEEALVKRRAAERLTRIARELKEAAHELAVEAAILDGVAERRYAASLVARQRPVLEPL